METAYQHGFNDAVCGKLRCAPYDHYKLADVYDRGQDAGQNATSYLSRDAARCLRDMLRYSGYHGQAASREARQELVEANLARVIEGNYTSDLRIMLLQEKIVSRAK
jgi:hypothetical protein